MDRVGIDDLHLVADEGLGRQQHRLGDEGMIERRVAERVADRLDHRLEIVGARRAIAASKVSSINCCIAS